MVKEVVKKFPPMFKGAEEKGVEPPEKATPCLRLFDKTGSANCKWPQEPPSQQGFRSSRLQPQRIIWLTQASMLVEAKQC